VWESRSLPGFFLSRRKDIAHGKKSLNAENLIQDYEIQLVEPPCLPGAAEWSARACVKTDISEVLPYLNAVLERADYDHETKVLIWKNQGHKYAFRTREIKVAPVHDRDEARGLVQEIAGRVNAVWKRRGEIEPDFAKRTVPSLMKVYMLLPRSNCGDCGYSTCMAFAAELREGNTGLMKCTALEKSEYAENLNRLRELF
jgi:ArsR family metal-binding transcriptional regulator